MRELMWIGAGLVGLTYPFITLAYFFLLEDKRREVDRLLRGKALTRYLRAYGHLQKGELYTRFYDWKAYVLPVLLNMVSVLGPLGGLLWWANSQSLAALPAVWGLLLEPARAALFGWIGAYLWGHADMIRRYGIIDLTPVSLYEAWLRLWIGGVVGAIVGAVVLPPVDLLVALGVGAFPVRSLVSWLQRQSGSRLGITQPDTADEASDLHALQGLSADVISRLAEENISSAHHLALANPIRLLLKTSFEWTLILDWIDQAILFIYVGDKIVALRQAGIRCAMELSDLNDYAESTDAAYRDRGDAIRAEVGRLLGLDASCLQNLIDTLCVDPQLDFVYSLWEEAFPEEPSSGRSP